MSLSPPLISPFRLTLLQMMGVSSATCFLFSGLLSMKWLPGIQIIASTLIVSQETEDYVGTEDTLSSHL